MTDRTNKIFCYALAAFVGGLLGLAFSEGTATATKITQGYPTKVTIAWTSSTNGWVSSTLTDTIKGEISKVKLVPTATKPASDYNVTLKDADGVDVLASKGLGASSNAVNSFVPGVIVTDNVTTSLVPLVMNDYVTLAVTNCGASRSGQVILFMK